MPEKIIRVDRIGNITFRKNKRSKNVSISMRPNKGILVTFPWFLTYQFALNVVEKKRSWILNNLPKIKQIENKATIFNENISFKSRSKHFLIQQSESVKKITTSVTSNQVVITYPQNINIETPENQITIKKAIAEALRIEAKNYLPGRTLELAQKNGFSFNKISIKNTKTLWGSCSVKNNINLNLHLIRLPDYLIDYVIIHELCHTIEKNHGQQFWKLMDTILGDAKKISKQLKEYSIELY